MVNEYLSPEEAEARSPYAQKKGNAGQETARAEAIAGQEVGFRGSYGGPEGRAAQNYAIIQQNKQAEQQRQQQAQQRDQQVQQKYMGWERDQQVITAVNSRTFLENMDKRAGYTAPGSLGDAETVRRLNAIPGDVDRNAALGTVLEQQRKEAESTPGTRDDQYFANELAKWHQNFVERGSEYHHETLATGVQQRANPYENQADIALAILKGGNQKDFTPDKYGFQPNVQETLNRLPGGQGIQENAWQVAKSGQPVQTDFRPAIDYLNSQAGKFGPYGNLYGGVRDTNTPPPSVNANRNAGTTPLNAQQSEPIGNARLAWNREQLQGNDTGKDWNPFVASAAEPIGYISEGVQLGQPVRTELPAGVFATGDFGRVETLTQGQPQEVKPLSFGGLIQDFTRSFELIKRGDILGGIGLYSQGLSRYSTRAAMPSAEGFGKYVETTDTSQSPISPFVAGAAYVGEQVYTDIRADPVQDVALLSLPLAFKVGEGVVSTAVAKAAVSEGKVVSTVGRGLSTPTAIDAGNVVKAGLVGLWGIQSAINVNVAPDTPEGTGRALGDVAYQGGMVYAGSRIASAYTPKGTTNPYESRTFFTGERKLPVTEKIMIRAGDWVNSWVQSKGQSKAIQDVSTEYMGKSATFTKPEITTQEPDLARLTHVGQGNAPLVKSAMVDQPSVMYGSGAMEVQVGKGPAAATLRQKALPSSDADVFTEFPAVMEAKAGSAAKGMDIHKFPEGYVDVGQGSNAQTQPGSYLFGNRYRVNPYADEITLPGKTEGYKGDIAFEHLNVQYRKLTSAVRDDVADPMNKGYRLGKDLSRLTRVRDTLEEVRVSRGEKPNAGAFDDMLKQTVTYNEQTAKGGTPNVRTDTLWNIRARYESNPKDLPDVFSPYSKGAVSNVGSSFVGLPFALGSPVPGRKPSPSSSSGSLSGSLVVSLPSQSPSSGSPRSPSLSPSIISPYSPSGSPSITPYVPPYSPPYSQPPSSPPSGSPPYSPPYSQPPSSPPVSTPPSYIPPSYTPPYSPPSRTPPYSPPSTVPGVPSIPGIPFFPGGDGGVRRMRGQRQWRNVFAVGLDLSFAGKTRPTLSRAGTYAAPPKMPKQKRRKRK